MKFNSAKAASLCSSVMIVVNIYMFSMQPNPITFFAVYILVTQKLLMLIEYNAWRYPDRSDGFGGFIFRAMVDCIAFPIVLVELFIYWRFSRHKNPIAMIVKNAIYGRKDFALPKLSKMFFSGFLIYKKYKEDPKLYRRMQKVQKKMDKHGNMYF